MLEITLKLSVRSYIVWTINWIFSISRSDQPNSSSHKYWMRERKENIQFAQVFLVPGTLRLPKTRSVFLYSSPSVYDIEDENNEKKDNGFSKMNIWLYCLNYILQIQMYIFLIFATGWCCPTMGSTWHLHSVELHSYILLTSMSRISHFLLRNYFRINRRIKIPTS